MQELNGRPLVDTLSDGKLYVTRDEHFALYNAARQRLNVIVAGDRGSGKTSLLRQTLLTLREDGEPAVFVDGKTASDPLALLELVRHGVAEVFGPPGPSRRSVAASIPGRARDRTGNLLDLLDLLSETVTGTVRGRIVLLVDGLPSPDAGHELFGRVRDELWQLPFSWLVAVDSRERAALMEPPADAFFDRLINLSRLSVGQSVDLLRRRTEGQSQETLERLAEAGEGNPRVLLALARDALEGGRAVDDLLESQAWRETAASQLSRPASMLLAEVEQMGSASASDEELLKRLGWTRPRASQVFGELEAAGLVTSREVRGHGGRPRKVFQVDRSFRGEA